MKACLRLLVPGNTTNHHLQKSIPKHGGNYHTACTLPIELDVWHEGRRILCLPLSWIMLWTRGYTRYECKVKRKCTTQVPITDTDCPRCLPFFSFLLPHPVENRLRWRDKRHRPLGKMVVANDYKLVSPSPYFPRGKEKCACHQWALTVNNLMPTGFHQIWDTQVLTVTSLYPRYDVSLNAELWYIHILVSTEVIFHSSLFPWVTFVFRSSLFSPWCPDNGTDWLLPSAYVWKSGVRKMKTEFTD